ncbi:hypothetical protein [Arenibacter certesii]|uniref:Uncharacterized protein n=1 Tax=Arenibacter certesii TaxID=228955 RepID=A0A918MN53_9FLAO|nr:hypothetical protein [Arenibacter certesii]GGW40502.1 hypothetical protein GCM10007383_26540 [Arenibacter certesii]
MSGAGHVADMNNRLNRNRALKPSNRVRFKESNRDTIYTDVAPNATKLSFKEVSATELKKIKHHIRIRAKKDRSRNLIVFIGIVLALLFFIFLILQGLL